MSHVADEAAMELLRVRANLFEAVLGKLGMQLGTQLKTAICSNPKLFSLMVCSLIERHKDLHESISLDDQVLDVVEAMGSDINNGGVGRQLQFLLEETNEVWLWETLTSQLTDEPIGQVGT